MAMHDLRQLHLLPVTRQRIVDTLWLAALSWPFCFFSGPFGGFDFPGEVSIIQGKKTSFSSIFSPSDSQRTSLTLQFQFRRVLSYLHLDSWTQWRDPQ